MRKLKLQMQVSVDGFVSAAGEKWMVWDYSGDWTWDDALRKYHTDMTGSIDCVLLSRKMAVGGFIDHWAEMAEQKGNPQAEFAGNVTRAHKVVFTKTLEASIWPDTELAKGDLAAEVNRLKSLPGKDMIVYGGASFVTALIGANLIDEYHLVVNPALVGRGAPIFGGVEHPRPLSLVGATAYGHGMVVLIYRIFGAC
jgi:dihydrofolate reductase